MGKLRFAGQVACSNLWRLAAPYKLLLCLTYRCNGHCLTCGIWKRAPPTKPELSLDEIRDFFSKNNRFSWVNLTGGEIFLRNDLPDILSTILSRCKNLCLLNFATNGLQPRKVERVLATMPRHPPSRTVVTVSVDGPERLNDTIRGTRGAFRKSLETFSRLRSLGREDVESYIGLTLSEHNAGTLSQSYDALRRELPSLERTDIHLNVAHASHHYYANMTRWNGNGGEEKRREILGDVEVHYACQPRFPLNPIAWLEKRYLSLLRDYLRTGKSPRACQALSASCYIDPVGMVYPCIVYDRPLGSLRSAGFELGRIWNSRKALALRQEIREGSCPNCWLACEAYQAIMGG